MKNYRLKIGIDCDDVLYKCNAYAVELLNKEKGYSLDPNGVKVWGKNGSQYDERIAYFKSPEFYKNQPLFSGAKEFINKLSKIAEIFFVTAVPPSCISARAERIISDFGEYVDPQNIIFATRKDVVRLDILLDDGSHNILKTPSTYGVLMRRPWNANLSGSLSVNTYDDFIHVVEMICNSYVETLDLSNGGVVCLVGPSGSGKTAITQELVKDKRFEKPLTTTTRARRDYEPEDAYRFTDEAAFLAEFDNGCFLETSVYGGYHYGTKTEDFDKIINEKRYAVIPIDICGAITMKNHFRSKCITLFIDRSRQDVLMEILSRNCSVEDKMKRIISLDSEYKNAAFCDFTINNRGSLSNSVNAVKKYLF